MSNNTVYRLPGLLARQPLSSSSCAVSAASVSSSSCTVLISAADKVPVFSTNQMSIRYPSKKEGKRV
ncbi:hypothetical protein AGABI2DRAFT_195211 [Agaricus bisporus var. bisporus H97]|uniref:hypothetical protein n=1 Tax=Agaricus bisporus var. bisporus (strain H97 / ATCC MYA-4626 / FGSC 10389) TaxID=936046 RepID=UPI00029F7DF5|nr:hypothetical protein AGABI2DRAFT_195211 [Agaricus bisporus var. bisporus H97]EKV43669.1 hypothetical protein AGABI2DRAFT_195211 [Agaricus bisporus var. bisporus H97]